MDTLHTVLRSIRGEKSRRDHLTVFREFLSHIERIGRKAARGSVKNKSARPSRRRGK